MLFRKSLAECSVESPSTLLAYGALAGLLATKAMEPVTSFLYEHEDEKDKKREEELRKELAPVTLAGRLIKLVGAEPTEQRKQRLGMMIHCAYGMRAGVLYASLRRRASSFQPRLRPPLRAPFVPTRPRLIEH